MKDQFFEDDVIAEIVDLTRPRLVFYVQAKLVSPQRTQVGLVYRRIDLARLELLCDLTDQFGMEEDVLGLILSLIDQLHGARSDMRSILDAVAHEPEEVRARLSKAVLSERAGDLSPD